MPFNPWVFGWSVLGLGLWIQRHWRASDPRRSLRMVDAAWALQWIGLAILVRSSPLVAGVLFGVGFVWFAASVLMPFEF